MSDEQTASESLKRDMLPGLLDELGRTRRRRAVRARLASAVTVAAMVAIAALLARVSTMNGPAATPVADHSLALSGATPIKIVHSTPAALSQWATTTDPGALAEAISRRNSGRTVIEILDDVQLLDALASAGRHAGIVRSQGRVWLSRSVTDPRPDEPG